MNGTLLVGCGGSGIKTLKKFNEMLSSNISCRQDIREKISYVVIDTEQKELEQFTSAIRHQMGGFDMPTIKTIKITENYNNLYEIVRKTIENIDKNDVGKLERLKQHWWFSPDGKPYRASGVTGIGDGAGQCPPVSFLTAWNYLPKLENEVQRVVGAIQNMNNGPRDTMKKLDVFIVSGIAGGTGRGLWNLVAFKIRQTIQKLGYDVNPEGFFFDASCFFETVRGAGPLENLKVNSLTAISELSAWLKLKSGAADFCYRLPNLSNPAPESDEDKSTDVISVADDAPEDSWRSPINVAYLVTGRNARNISLRNNDEYHKMIAAALYAKVVHRGEIGGLQVNQRREVLGVAAQVFEVDTAKLRLFFENRVRRCFADSLFADTGDTLKEEVKTLLGPTTFTNKDDFEVAAKEGRFFAKTKLYASEEDKETISNAAIDDQVSPEASLVKILMNKTIDTLGGWETEVDRKGKDTGKLILAQTKAFLDTLYHDDNIDRAKEEAGNGLDLSADENSLMKALRVELNKLNLLDFDDDGDKAYADSLINAEQEVVSLQQTIRNAVFGALNYKGKMSLNRCLATAKRLQKTFTDSLSAIGEGEQSRNFSLDGQKGGSRYNVKDADECISVVGSAIDIKGKINLADAIRLRHFNDEEIEELRDLYQELCSFAIFFKVKKVIGRKLISALKVLDQIIASLNNLGVIFQKVCTQFDDELKKDFKADKGDVSAVYNNLFIDNTSVEKLCNSLPELSDSERYFCRILKPIMSQEEISELLQKDSSRHINDEPVLAKLMSVVETFIQNGITKLNNQKEMGLLEDLYDVIKTNVSLKNSADNRDFMEINFSFASILEKNIDNWNVMLEKVHGDPGRFERVKDKLRQYVGIGSNDYKYYNNTLVLERKTVWKKILCEMYNSCLPWIQISGEEEDIPSLSQVVLPIRLGDSEYPTKEEFQQAILGESYGTAEVVPISSRADYPVSPDRIVIYRTGAPKEADRNPFDKIQTLTYWQENDVKAKLILSEDATGKSYFEQEGNVWKERSRGFGYVSPFFLTNETISRLRWKPWLGKAGLVDKGVVAEKQAVQALFYALLGNMNDNAPESSKEFLALLKTNHNITLPLCQFNNPDKPKTLFFTRYAIKNVNGKMEINKQSPWTNEDDLGGSWEVSMQFLRGEGKGNAKFDEIKERGNAWRNGLLAEEKDYYDIVSSQENINKSQYKDLIKQTCEWLFTNYTKNSSGENKKVVDKLISFGEELENSIK